MSIQALSWVLEHSEAKLGARCLLVAIANHADECGGDCWASVETLAREARLSERQAQRNLRKLEEDGLIEVDGVHEHRTTIYRIVGVSERHPAQARDVGNVTQTSIEEPETTQEAGSGDISGGGGDAERLALLMAELVAERTENPRVLERATSASWVTPIDRLLRLDGRSPEMVERAIRWVHDDEFWRSNILSTAKLRAQFDRLLLEAKRKRDGGKSSGSIASIRRDGTDYGGQVERAERAGGH